MMGKSTMLGGVLVLLASFLPLAAPHGVASAAQNSCCFKRAFCCSLKRNCCPKTLVRTGADPVVRGEGTGNPY